MKKSWKKPQLKVLVRGRVEEAVLAGCKSLGSVPGSTGPVPGVWRCMSTATACKPQCVVKTTT